MSTEDLLEDFIEECTKEFKRKYRNTKVYRTLSRHENFVYRGITFNYWRELSVFTTGKWIKDNYPDTEIEINLDGNKSNIETSMSEEDMRKLTSRLYVILKERGVA